MPAKRSCSASTSTSFNTSTATTIDINAVAEGGEFQRSHFYATFQAPHYDDVTTYVHVSGTHSTRTLPTPTSRPSSTLHCRPTATPTHVDLSDLTAGAVAVAKQEALPNSLSGVVFLDHNLNNHQDAGRPGTRRRDAGAAANSTARSYVATGMTTVTDTQGNYQFDNLEIGKFRVVETQPPATRAWAPRRARSTAQTRGVVTTCRHPQRHRIAAAAKTASTTILPSTCR